MCQIENSASMDKNTPSPSDQCYGWGWLIDKLKLTKRRNSTEWSEIFWLCNNSEAKQCIRQNCPISPTAPAHLLLLLSHSHPIELFKICTFCLLFSNCIKNLIRLEILLTSFHCISDPGCPRGMLALRTHITIRLRNMMADGFYGIP